MKKQKQPAVAIIILHWGDIKDTIDLLASLQKVTYSNFHIYLADPLGTLSASKLKQKNVDIVRLPANLGFSGNNNFVLKKIKDLGYEYALLLNNDTLVHADFLTFLVNSLELEKTAAAAAPTILYADSDSEVWFGGGELSLRKGEVHHLGLRKKIKELNMDTVAESSFLTGCCLLISQEAINRVGLMDDEYFLYWEDADWCVRMRKMGYKLLYVPQAAIEHKVSKGVGVNSPPYLYYIFRNNLLFIRKYVKIRWKWLAWLVLLKKVAKELVKLFIRYKKDHKLYFGLISRAFIDNAKRKYGKL